MIYDRSNGCNCPICSGHKVLVGYNDLASLNPELAKEWHPTKNGNLKPTQVTLLSEKKVIVAKVKLCSKIVSNHQKCLQTGSFGNIISR